jgi:hypothetical protein
VYVSDGGPFTKSGGGVIYGNNAGVKSNNAGSGFGHAVYWSRSSANDGPLYRYATLGVGDNISTNNPNTGWNDPIPPLQITTTAQWNAALAAIRNNNSGTSGTPKTYTIYVNGDIAVPGSSATGTSFGSVQYVAVTLKGSGTLSLNSNGSILYVGANQTLIIDDANLTLQGRDGNNRAVIDVQNNGTLELKNGTITGNASSSYPYGGGVYVSGGTFTMAGGTISGNTISSSLSNNYGGGVYVDSNGTFSKTNGTIYGYNANDTVNSNVVKDRSGVVLNDRGHTVYATGNNVTKRKETTAGPWDSLYFDNGSFAGAWDY